MKINVEKFLEKEVKLPKNNILLPLFEAISNSIFADSKNIELNIEYIKKDSLIDLWRIKNLDIIDDGEGFTDFNYDSFNNAYESNKKNGKGKGRFFFLKICKECIVKSVYKDNDRYYERKFKFLPDQEGVHLIYNKEIQNVQNLSTVVKLLDFNINYNFALELEEIGNLILNRFLMEFMKNDFLNITLKDNLGNNISLRTEYEKIVEDSFKKEEFIIEDVKFELFYLLMKPIQSFNKSTMIFTAEQRGIKEKELESVDKLFANRIKDKILKVYISSEYLDERVSVDRDSFEFELKITSKIQKVISLERIEEHVIKKLKEVLKIYIDEIEEHRSSRLNKYFKTSINSSDKLLFDKYGSELLKEISGNEKDKSIEEVFDQKRRSLRKEIEKDIKSINFEEEVYREKIKEIKEKIDVSLHSALADYIIQRKAILKLYSKILQGEEKLIEKKTGIKKEYSYSLESEVHNLIFPMKTTSDNIDYNNHNLWLIDESLAFQTFISSDLELKRFIKDSESEDRPDLLFFSEYDPDDNLDSVTLIELKRPEVDTSKKEETPHEQVMRYVKQLRNRELDIDGKTINTTEKTRFYCYILLDLNKKNEEIFIDSGYTPLREHKGYIYYHATYKMHVTVLDYRELKRDAERRNRIFFEKLGIDKI